MLITPFRVVTALLLSSTLVFAQAGISGPPACPAKQSLPTTDAVKQQSAVDFHPVEVKRPSVEAARATAEQEAQDPSILIAAEPLENFGVARYRLHDYGDCTGTGGCYWKDLDAQLRRAESILKTALQDQEKGSKVAMVLDIDETTLSSYCEMQVEDFGYIPELFNSWVVKPEAAVLIPGTLRLFQTARSAGVSVFFLTGRPEEQRAATERNLHAAGFNGWAGVLLRDQAEKRMTTIAYKSQERAKLAAAGYMLILNVGDQWSDLIGDSKADRNVKLPNPFYYLP